MEERTLGRPRPRANPKQIVTQVPSRSSLSPRLAVLWIALIPVSTQACSPTTEPLRAPGRSNRPPGGATVPAKPHVDAGPTRWERWPEVATYRLALPRAPSQHLAGDHDGEVLASVPAAAYPDLGPTVALPPESVLVQRLYATGAAAPDVVFAMVRRASAPESSPSPIPSTEVAVGGDPTAAWEFLILDADGTIESRGQLEPCARCHAEAPHGGVFGRAR